jgi:DNA-binding response OmpR family regulator
VNSKIFIADDNEAIADSLCIALEDEGFRVRAITGGEVAGALRSFMPDVAILDVWLEGNDGGEICRQLKHSPKMQGVSVILISAHKDLANVARQAGADDYAAKPFDIGDLISRIYKLLGHA